MRLCTAVRGVLYVAALLVASYARGDSTAWTWGLNHVGQLGNGTSQIIGRPAEVTGLHDVVKVALGSTHGLALCADGSVWAWGYNGRGQLGNGTNTPSPVPVQVVGLSDVVDIAAGSEHSLALRADGSVWAWGNNDSGQLGNGTNDSASVPVGPVLSGVRAIAAGHNFSVAVRADGGLVWAWGDNSVGQLGDGTTTNRNTPVYVHGTSGVKAVSAGWGHGLALRADGRVLAWGNNGWGQLGDGTTETRLEAIVVPDLQGISGIDAGQVHSLAWGGGFAYAWGDNTSGQLGDGTYVSSSVPLMIAVMGVRKMSGGAVHSLAVDLSGGLWAWGWNGYGELGMGTNDSTNYPIPLDVPGDVVDVDAGDYQSAAVRYESSTMGWGFNGYGQLGDGTMNMRWAPTLTQGLLGTRGALQVTSGFGHTAAVDVGGAVWAWGNNDYGQLGTGDTVSHFTPVQVSPSGSVVAAATGDVHSVAVTWDGRVYACGLNTDGQLGDGTTETRLTPVESHISGVIAVAAGGGHTLALRSDGTVWAWGRNHRGQLGDGTTTNRLEPVHVWTIQHAVAIAAGQNHSLAITADGAVYAWGANDYGQLGDGTTTDRLLPVAVTGLSNVTEIAAGSVHSLFRRVDGTVWACGWNAQGQLGDGTNTDAQIPVQVASLTTVKQVGAGTYHSMAITGDGLAWTWGSNATGELGDPTVTERNTPGAVVWISYPYYYLNLDGGTCGSGGSSLAVTSYGVSSLQVTPIIAKAGQTVQLTATLTQNVGTPAPTPLSGQTVTFSVNGVDVGTAVTNASGVAQVSYTVPDTAYPEGWAYQILAKYQPGGFSPSGTYGAAPLAYEQAATSLYVPDRTGTVGEFVILRAYLRRLTDNAWVAGRWVEFYVDGTWAGWGVTNASGRADLNYQIWPGPSTRAIDAYFHGDSFYAPSHGQATLTAVVWTTKMATFDRTARITDRTELKCRLVRSDNQPIYGKQINFYVDGTFVIARMTDTQGYAKYPYYDVPDGAGAGTRTILSEWAGDDGYLPVSKTATLTVLKALPYIWVLPKSVPQGSIANLYAYFRRLYDYKKQEGKEVTFLIDGTWLANVVTGTTESGEPGVARYFYNTGNLNKGVHTIDCIFAGDAWVESGGGQATLTIY